MTDVNNHTEQYKKDQQNKFINFIKQNHHEIYKSLVDKKPILNSPVGDLVFVQRQWTNRHDNTDLSGYIYQATSYMDFFVEFLVQDNSWGDGVNYDASMYEDEETGTYLVPYVNFMKPKTVYVEEDNYDSCNHEFRVEK